MKIRHERPDATFEFDVKAPLKITTATGAPFKVSRWNMSRLYSDDGASLPSGDVRVAVPFQGFEIDFDATIETISDTEAAFVNLTGRQRELLSVFYQNMLTGKMAEVDEVITSLDTPVDLVPMSETEDEEAANAPAENSSRKLRSVMQLMYYAGLFFFLIFVVGGTIHRKFDRITIQHGRFEAPVAAIQAPISGFVKSIPAQTGETVSAGDIIAKLEDPNLEIKLDDIRAEIKGAKLRMARAEAQIDAHMLGFEDARRPYLEDIEIAVSMRPEDGSLDVQVETIVRQARGRLARFESGMSDRQGDFNDRLGSLQELHDERALTLRNLKSRLGNQKNAMQNLTLRAPTDGYIVDVESFEGQFLRAGSDVLLFEENTPRLAVGYLNQRNAQKVHEGMLVNLKFYGEGETHRAKGMIRAIVAADNPRRPGEAGFAVHVVPIMEPGMKREACVPDAPVEIVLDRRLVASAVERAKNSVLAQVGRFK